MKNTKTESPQPICRPMNYKPALYQRDACHECDPSIPMKDMGGMMEQKGVEGEYHE